MSDERIADVLTQPNEAQRVVPQLADDALEGGGSDNVTLALLRIEAA